MNYGKIEWLPFVFPKGVFADEEQMIARGAGQPIACPAGTIYAAPKRPDRSASPRVPAETLGRTVRGDLIITK